MQATLKLLVNLSFMLLDVVITTARVNVFHLQVHLELYVRRNLKPYLCHKHSFFVI